MVWVPMGRNNFNIYNILYYIIYINSCIYCFPAVSLDGGRCVLSVICQLSPVASIENSLYFLSILCFSTYFFKKNRQNPLFFIFFLLTFAASLRAAGADILIKSVLRYYPLLESGQFQRMRIISKKRSRCCYIPAWWAVYIPIGVGYCLLLILRQSRASNKVIFNSSCALFCIWTLALGAGRQRVQLTIINILI